MTDQSTGVLMRGVPVRINGVDVDGAWTAETRLIDIVRDQLGLTGTKEACGVGECGACTLLVGGVPTLSCITIAARVTADVETIEGIAQESSRLRRELASRGGVQCGFCTPGVVVSAVALLREGGQLTEQTVRRRLAGNICRCTGYTGIVEAVLATAGTPAKDPQP
jgi:aerobic-type carbon monoxide dehydrogenase small subunit (CoxS/CutS family)